MFLWKVLQQLFVWLFLIFLLCFFYFLLCLLSFFLYFQTFWKCMSETQLQACHYKGLKLQIFKSYQNSASTQSPLMASGSLGKCPFHRLIQVYNEPADSWQHTACGTVWVSLMLCEIHSSEPIKCLLHAFLNSCTNRAKRATLCGSLRAIDHVINYTAAHDRQAAGGSCLSLWHTNLYPGEPLLQNSLFGSTSDIRLFHSLHSAKTQVKRYSTRYQMGCY